MFTEDKIAPARDLLDELRKRGLKIVTAESCTGGLIAALLTEIPGSSDVFERGFVTYSNDAKAETLGVPRAVIEQFGAVSREVAVAMAEGALARSKANIAVAVTGIAGPGGGSVEKPVGLVIIAAARKQSAPMVELHAFGAIGRQDIRLASAHAALKLALKLAAR